MKYLRHVLRSAPALLGLMILGSAPSALAQANPAGCTATGVTISLTVFFADGVTPALGIPVSPCETLVYVSSLSYAGAPNCGFENGFLLITTPDGVVHDVTPAGGINGPNLGGPVTDTDPGPVFGNPVTYVVNPADVVGGMVSASTSWNVAGAPFLPKGVTFIGPPGGVEGVSSASTSIPNTVTDCPGTFCAPEICDPAATDPVNFPGRQGLCVAGTPPVCPVVPPVGENPLCFQAVCDPQSDQCVTSPIVPPPAVCTRVPCGNRGRIKKAAAPAAAQGVAAAASVRLDKLSIALRPFTNDAIDPSGMDVTVLMATDNGQFFSATLPAGSLKHKGQYYKYTNPAASKTGGISKLTIWRKAKQGGTQIYADAYGDLSGAKSVMDSAVVIGGIQYNHDGTWTPIPNGWRFP